MAEPPFDVETEEALATCRRQLPATLSGGDVCFGFDGMIDAVMEMVETRHGPESYTPVPTLDAFAGRLQDSASQNSSVAIDWVQTGTRLGGHSCHLGRFFGSVGYDPSMIGTYGQPIRDAFEAEFGAYDLHSVGAPGETHAVEFEDGKCMFAQAGSYIDFDWPSFRDAVSLETLTARLEGARLFGIGYWLVIPRLPSILTGLREEVWPTLSDPPDRILLDTGDIRQFESERIEAGIEPLERLDDVADLTLSANRVETLALANAVAGTDPDRDFVDAATAVFDQLDVTRFVGHNVDFSLALADAGTARVTVPRVDDPEMTTSAGDHFNAGFALGKLEGLADGAALVLGNAVARSFVQSGTPPSFETIRSTVAAYDELRSS